MPEGNASADMRMHGALTALLEALEARGYRFVAITPESHARVLARRRDDRAQDLRDVFGWSLPFEQALLPPDVLAPLCAADLLEPSGPLWKSRVRIASLDGRLFLHSAYPTDRDDAVFFGPDSYRFAAFLAGELQREPVRGPVLDIGAGSGVGAVVAATAIGQTEAVLTDINPRCFPLARANAGRAGVTVHCVLTPGLSDLPGPFGLIVANPPFLDDAQRRAYRHGGAQRGGQLSLAWAEQAAGRLAPGGAFLLYTGSAIVGGEDRIRACLETLARNRGLDLGYRELDPDIFGEMLAEPGYAEVDRIAAVGARLSRPG